MKWGWDKGNINQKKLLKGLHFTASLLKWRDKGSILAHLWKSYFAPWIPCSFRKSWGRWPIVLKTRLITAEIGCFLPFVSCKIYIKNHLSWNSTKEKNKITATVFFGLLKFKDTGSPLCILISGDMIKSLLISFVGRFCP